MVALANLTDNKNTYQEYFSHIKYFLPEYFVFIEES